MSRIRGRLAALLLLAVVSLPGGLAVPPPAAAADFPPTHAGYHTYAEMVADIHAVATAHPGIVSVFSIGKSYKGRDIWAAKISDNVGLDENEPEVLFDGLHHAREHLSLEMTLAILHWLSGGYGHDATATRLVKTRETWIIFAVNPDGGQYDLSGNPASPFRGWRKNRQPTPGSTSIGTDLNRNYGYHFGCCGGSSGNPAAIDYRGPAAWSAPETRAVRDFVLSRVIDGRQQIRMAITFHTQGEQVLWPYGYTKRNIPPDMTVEDWTVFSTLGRQMAATNHYKPEQSSDLYVTDGDEIDWLYGTQRIFVYTFEMYPKEGTIPGLRRFYPPSSVIRRETTRNLSAVRRLMDVAGCPYAVIGRQVADCGAFFDDLETARGWTVNPDGTDTATAGTWERGTPAGTFLDGVKQPASVPSGSKAFATGRLAGDSAGANDLDGGTTTLLSPPIRIPAGAGQRLTFRYVFAHDAAASAEEALQDTFMATVIGETGSATAMLVRGSTSDVDATWKGANLVLDQFSGQVIRIRFTATDGGADNLVEALFDDVRVTRPK